MLSTLDLTKVKKIKKKRTIDRLSVHASPLPILTTMVSDTKDTASFMSYHSGQGGQ